MPKSKQFLNAAKKSGKKSTVCTRFSTDAGVAEPTNMDRHGVQRVQTSFLLVQEFSINSSKNKKQESSLIHGSVGVEREEAGEKWRAGDAAKSTRFFVRAIEDYDTGLAKFPQSFDLAYNKARLQYDLAQQPRLLAHLPFSSMDLLELALESHRYALDINQDNADLLLYASFLSSNKDGTLILASNTAQVLTSLVEASTELKHSADNQINGMRFLQEALGLFQRCLSLQESQIMQSEEEHATSKEDTSDNDDGGTATRTDTAEGATSEEAWASIEEPVTRNSLIDTVIAQLETLTTICSLVISQGGDNLDWVEEYYSNMLKDKITLLVHDTERVQEASLANAKFIAAFSDASFRHGQLDILEYERELTAAFTINPDLSNHHEGLCDRADAEITFSTSIQASAQSKMQLSGSDSARLKEMRWKHITKALDDLRAASKTPHAEKLPRIHLRRGDCELLRYRLGQGPNPHSTAAKSASTLVKNAEVYYRGAAALARNARVQEEEREALVKEAILASLSGCKRKLHDLLKTNEKAVLEIIEDMREENLLSDEDIPI